MKKLTLRQARILFNKGKKIYLKPSKLSQQVIQYSPWFNWYEAQFQPEEPCTFDAVVNEYSYYNCNKEVGLKVNYYAYI